MRAAAARTASRSAAYALTPAPARARRRRRRTPSRARARSAGARARGPGYRRLAGPQPMRRRRAVAPGTRPRRARAAARSPRSTRGARPAFTHTAHRHRDRQQQQRQRDVRVESPLEDRDQRVERDGARDDRQLRATRTPRRGRARAPRPARRRCRPCRATGIRASPRRGTGTIRRASTKHEIAKSAAVGRSGRRQASRPTKRYARFDHALSGCWIASRDASAPQRSLRSQYSSQTAGREIRPDLGRRQAQRAERQQRGDCERGAEGAFPGEGGHRARAYSTPAARRQRIGSTLAPHGRGIPCAARRSAAHAAARGDAAVVADATRTRDRRRVVRAASSQPRRSSAASRSCSATAPRCGSRSAGQLPHHAW